MTVKLQHPLQADRAEIGGKASLFAMSPKETNYRNKTAQKPGFRHAGLDMRDADGTNRAVCAPEDSVIVKLLRYLPEDDGYNPSVVILKSIDSPVRYHFLAHLDRNSKYWDGLYVGKKVQRGDIIGEYDIQMNHVHWEVRPAVHWQGQKDSFGNYIDGANKWIANYSPMHLVTTGQLVRGDQLVEPEAFKRYLANFKQFPYIEDNSYAMQHESISRFAGQADKDARQPEKLTTPPGTPATPDDDRQTAATSGSSSGGISVLALAVIGIGAYFLLKKRP